MNTCSFCQYCCLKKSLGVHPQGDDVIAKAIYSCSSSSATHFYRDKGEFFCLITNRQTFSHCRLLKSCVGSGLPPHPPRSWILFGRWRTLSAKQYGKHRYRYVSYNTNAALCTKTFSAESSVISLFQRRWRNIRFRIILLLYSTGDFKEKYTNWGFSSRTDGSECDSGRCLWGVVFLRKIAQRCGESRSFDWLFWLYRYRRFPYTLLDDKLDFAARSLKL